MKSRVCGIAASWKWREHRDLIKKIEELGCVFIRHGGKHDWYQNPVTKIAQPVPRHREIKEHLARHVLKLLAGSR